MKNGNKPTLTMNFDFVNWTSYVDGKPCSDPSVNEACIKNLAIHEFGHALALQHEQQRDDTAGWCNDQLNSSDGNNDILTEKDGITYIGPWDGFSMMNYCSADNGWNNGGMLSKGDIQTIQVIYGARESRPQSMLNNKGKNLAQNLDAGACFPRSPGISESLCAESCNPDFCVSVPIVRNFDIEMPKHRAVYTLGNVASTRVKVVFGKTGALPVKAELVKGDKTALLFPSVSADSNGIIEVEVSDFDGATIDGDWTVKFTSSATTSIEVKDIAITHELNDSAAPAPPQPKANFSWVAGDFGDCSVNCNAGIKNREVTCHNDDTALTVADTKCDAASKPEISQACMGDSCAAWAPYSWSECSSDCGDGTQTRFVACRRGSLEVDALECLTSAKPASSQDCTGTDCAVAKDECWMGTYWTTELGSTRTCVKVSMSKCDAGYWGHYKGTQAECCEKAFSWATPHCLVMDDDTPDNTPDNTPDTASNHAPTASNATAATDQATAVVITLVGDDADGDELDYLIVDGPAHGDLTGSGATRTYTPDADFFGTDAFTFKVNDGEDDSAVATVSITVAQKVVAPINNAPVAVASSAKPDQDNAVAVTLSASDADGDVLSYIIVDSPANGAIEGSGANRTYTPDPGFHGTDTFTFKANDGQSDSATVSVSVEVAQKVTAPKGSASCWYGTYWTPAQGSTRTCTEEPMSKCDSGAGGYYKGTKADCCEKHFSWAGPNYCLD